MWYKSSLRKYLIPMFKKFSCSLVLTIFIFSLTAFAGSKSGVITTNSYNLDIQIQGLSFPNLPENHKIQDGNDLIMNPNFVVVGSNVDLDFDFEIKIFLDGNLVDGCGGRASFDVETGEVINASCGADDFRLPGKYKFVVTADPRNLIRESAENNNTFYLYTDVAR